MKQSRPMLVTLIAIFQFIPALMLPPDLLLSTNPLVLLVPILFFAFLGWAMLTLKKWGMTACIFVQGLNVIARLLIVFPHAVGVEGADWAFVITSLLSIVLSSAIVYVIDQPKIHVAFAG
jgi:hypothetical protein